VEVSNTFSGRLATPLVVLLLSAHVPCALSDESIRCSSVSTVDLRNSLIDGLQFVDGEGCSSDENLPDKCDWKHEISSDELLYPTRDKPVRLVVINSSHVTGSGASDAIKVFDCIRGSLRKIFEKHYFYGAKIEKGPDGHLIFTSGNWKKTDPMCCPSETKKETYRWNADSNTYDLVSTVITPKAEIPPVNDLR